MQAFIPTPMNEISVEELKQLMDENADFLVIDVREKEEYETGNIQGLHIPMGDIMARISEVPTDKRVIMQCRSGGRSGNVVRYLSIEKGYTNLYNLAGGLLAWKSRIDPNVEVL